ncbi:MAG: hypothetical protein FWD65_04405 [Coriobacteriia bacterium]|nr:hypothetical protein [Coriobacteriia bacterium]
MNERTKIAKAAQTLIEALEGGNVVSITDAADLLGVARPVASDLVKRGLLDAVTPAPIPRLVTRASVETYKAHRDGREKAGRYGEGNTPPRYE